jgi:hypothetical protein
LRNILEEADEALSGTSFRPEDIRVLEAAGESKNVLNRLDKVLQQDSGKAAGSEPDDTVADFKAQLGVVTQKLSDALQDLEQASGGVDVLLAETRREHQRYPSASTASIEQGRGVSRDTSIRSSNTSHSSYDMVRSSPEPANKMPAIAEQKVLSDDRAFAGSRLSPAASQHRYSNNFNPADPLALAIEEASSMIMNSSAGTHLSVDRPTSLTSITTPPNLSPNLHAGPTPLFRAHTDPSRTAQIEALRPRGLQPGASPPHETTTMPVFYSRPTSPWQYGLQAQPGASPQSSLPDIPMRPRYYIANPERDARPPVELPADDEKAILNGAYRTWQPAPQGLPQYTPRQPSGVQQQHPALRNFYGSNEAQNHSSPNLPVEKDQPSRPSHHATASLPRPLSRADSRSSEVLTPDMRSASRLPPAVAESTEPAQSRPGTACLNQEQMNDAIRQWNGHNWNEAEHHLNACLMNAMNAHSRDLIRRLHHLLGALASVRGQWQQALTHFIAVLRAAIIDDTQLYDGDCAAAYWLGDTYCMLNRRAEALTAFLVAEHSSLFRGTQLRQRILAEQKACVSPSSANNTATPDDWKLGWEREVKKVDRTSPDSILNPKILTTGAEKIFLDRARVRAEARQKTKNQHLLDPNHSRVMAFRVLGADAGSYELDYRLRIGPSAFETTGPWPLMFDPYFAMASVLRGRLQPAEKECDLLSLIKFDPSPNLPKAARGKKAHFTSPDLQWLIITIRECFLGANMVITETANATEGYCFIGSWPTSLTESNEESKEGKSQGGIATTHFLPLTVFRNQSFSSGSKSGYGVDIASEGLFSARIVRGDWLFDKGVPTQETERVRAMVLGHLENKEKERGGVYRTETKAGRRRGVFSSRSSISDKLGSLSSR